MLNERESITLLKALTLAGGLDHEAAPQHPRIPLSNPHKSSREEIPVNLQQLLEGEPADVPMKREEILFIPRNVSKKAALWALEAAIQRARV